jgi:hypothetical protein
MAMTGSDAGDAVTIGTSREGRPLELLVLADPIDQADKRPAILVVAGIDGRHELGPLLVDQVVEKIRTEHAELLSEITLYVLPRMNPDAIAANEAGGAFLRTGTSRVIDDDRDGLTDEDPPRDLNGDGMITMMRWASPTLEDPHTHLPDPGEVRLMKTPDRKKGELATHMLLVEGIDADGDGLIGEDGPEGVDLNRNFTHLWPEHQVGAGPYSLSEYESRALAEFVMDHPNIVAAVVYGPHDNLVHEPNSKDKDITGRTPKALDGNDKEAHKQVMAKFKEIVGQERSAHPGGEGSFHLWLYAHRGIPTYATTGWGRPKPTDPPEKEGEEQVVEDEGDDEEKEEKTKEQPEPANKEDAQWLAYSDRDRGGTGFVEWTEFEHPTLGTIEIGGWAPGFKMNPPADAIPGIAEKHADWIAELASMQARLATRGPATESLGGGITRIRFAVGNQGALPTRTAHAVRTRANLPTIVRLEGVPDARILEGRPVIQIDRLKPGEEKIVEWLVRLEPTDAIHIEVMDPVLNVSLEAPVEVDR